MVGRLDTSVDSLFDGWRGRPAVDRLLYGASALGEHGTVWIMLAALRGLRGERHWKPAIRVMAGLAIESVTVNGVVKSVFRRRRPVLDIARPLPLRIPLTSSFPSGHASSSFFAARLLSEGDPRLAPAYYALAVVIAASRIHVKIHHASDVIAGAIVGTALAEGARRLIPLER
jgi:undecaprenyl-diphosphatase